MKLHEYIKTELTIHYDLFQTQGFKDGLDRYLKRYNQYIKDAAIWMATRARKKNVDTWLNDNPPPSPLMLGVSYTDDVDTKAMAAALLACLHDSYITGTPVLKQWPDDVKQYLKNNVTRFDRMQGESIESVLGLEFKNTIQLAIKTFNNDSDITIKDGQHENWLLIDLATNEGKRRCRTAIQKATGIGTTKLRELLIEFEQKGLLHRPDGERSGYVITSKGLSLYKKLNPPKA